MSDETPAPAMTDNPRTMLVAVTERVVILRGGCRQGEVATADVDADRLSHMAMSGRMH